MPLDVLHDQGRACGVEQYIMHLDHVRVAELGQERRLGLELRELVGRCELEGHRAPKGGVRCDPHLAEGPRADAAAELIPALDDGSGPVGGILGAHRPHAPPCGWSQFRARWTAPLLQSAPARWPSYALHRLPSLRKLGGDASLKLGASHLCRSGGLMDDRVDLRAPHRRPVPVI